MVHVENHTLFGDDDFIQSKMMDPRKLSSVGGNSQLPPSPLRNRDQNQLFVGRRISILGYDLHRSEQIRDGNVRRKTRKPRRPKWSTREETCSVTNHQANTPTPKSKLKFNTMILSCPMSIMFLQALNFLVLAPCFILEDNLRSGDQDDHQRQKPNSETRVPNLENCA